MSDTLPPSPPRECFAVYSQKQFDHIKKMKEDDCEYNNDFPYIYYKTDDDRIIQITEIFHNNKKRSNFDDAKYLGKVKKFYCAVKEAIPILQQIKYEEYIP